MYPLHDLCGAHYMTHVVTVAVAVKPLASRHNNQVAPIHPPLLPHLPLAAIDPRVTLLLVHFST